MSYVHIFSDSHHEYLSIGVTDESVWWVQDCVHVLAYIRSNEGFSKEEARSPGLNLWGVKGLQGTERDCKGLKGTENLQGKQQAK